jgi:hypothetical protein
MNNRDDLSMLAQRSAEERLHLAADLLFEENDGLADEHPAYAVLAGPYCGCDTCVVREVLDAAWPFLKQIALMEGPDEL